MALIGSSARTRPTERARVRHGARTLSWPRDAGATSLRALTRAVTLDQRHAPHSLLSCSPQPAPIAKLSLCENTGTQTRQRSQTKQTLTQLCEPKSRQRRTARLRSQFSQKVDGFLSRSSSDTFDVHATVRPPEFSQNATTPS